ncbi:hypothetical protein LCGC14_1887050 [marine sediment metagenome]|uniref:Uncharacterized protein n=1 Tax=marine sediment metagenome TaxID=412755 RepID=A0A0F9GNX1_9ZZZZ
MVIKFKKFPGKVIIGDKPVNYRVSIQTVPAPTAVVLSTDTSFGIVTIALDDWPEVVAAVEDLKQELEK